MDNPFNTILVELRQISDRLSILEKGIVAEAGEPEYIDTKTLCKRIGVSQPTAIRWRKTGKLPFIQIDGIVRYDWGVVKNKFLK